MVKHVCLVSGGTGGHLLPAVVLARALRAAGHDTVLLTEGREAESALLDRFSCPARTLQVGGRGVGLPLRLASATWEARRLLQEEEADLVVGTGGGNTVPAAMAARSLGVPTVLLEQNAVAGRANRLALPLARRIYLGLPPCRPLRRALLTGTPVRDGLGALDREVARERLGLAAGVPCVLVTGGSQGAQVLNETVPEALCGLRRPVQVLHLCGMGSDQAVRLRYAAGEDHGVEALVRCYAADMATYYAAADLIVCRGGGGTVAELAAAGRGAIIVPYPHHRDRQQFHNAKVLEAVEAAVIVEQSELRAASLSPLIGRLLEPECSRRMGERARRVAGADPCGTILEDLHRVAGL